MSVDAFCRCLPTLPFGKNDRKWFPRWIRRYAGSLDRGKQDALPISESDVIRFSQSLRDHGVPAWQRLQAVRAVEAYRQHILNTDQPSLREVKLTLQHIAAHERRRKGVGHLFLAQADAPGTTKTPLSPPPDYRRGPTWRLCPTSMEALCLAVSKAKLIVSRGQSSAGLLEQRP